MYLGRYDYEGDPDDLVAAYDTLMTQIPPKAISFHICIRRDGGITVYDTCPTAEIWRAMASDQGLRDAMTGAGLPEPTVTPLGEAHSAKAAAAYVT